MWAGLWRGVAGCDGGGPLWGAARAGRGAYGIGGAPPMLHHTPTLAALPPIAALPRFPKTHRPIFITRPPDAVAPRPARSDTQCVPPPSLPARPQP